MYYILTVANSLLNNFQLKDFLSSYFWTFYAHEWELLQSLLKKLCTCKVNINHNYDNKLLNDIR